MFIIISASFMSFVVDFVEARLGKNNFIFFIGSLLVISGVVFSFLIVRRHSHFVKTLLFIWVLIMGLIFASQIKIPVERIHILEYGILGWFTGRDLITENKKVGNFLVAGLFVFIVGVFDELFQKVLPYRVYDVRDIVFNGLGGAWGISLYLLS